MAKARTAVLFCPQTKTYYKLKDFVSGKPENFSLIDFNYISFINNLIKENTLAEIRYYIGAVKRQSGLDKQKAEKLYANQQKFLAKLQN